ncbi:MAG: PIN domain-containing protein [Chloroflexota bacterium]|jgi:predicted nucleic acid-binding protein
MRIYLDNCCFNRPFDDQSSIRIRLETEAKLFIQQNILHGTLILVWSYILDYENNFNPFEERRVAIELWKNNAVINVLETSEVISIAQSLQEYGIKSKDALHVACAISSTCDYFISTDDLVLKKLAGFNRIQVINPRNFVDLLETNL